MNTTVNMNDRGLGASMDGLNNQINSLKNRLAKQSDLIAKLIDELTVYELKTALKINGLKAANAELAAALDACEESLDARTKAMESWKTAALNSANSAGKHQIPV